MSDPKIITADQARKLLKGATPSPWLDFEEDYFHTIIGLGERSVSYPIICDVDEQDAALIAAAPDLAATVIQQAEQIERLRVIVKGVSPLMDERFYRDRGEWLRDLVADGSLQPGDMPDWDEEDDS